VQQLESIPFEGGKRDEGGERVSLIPEEGWESMVREKLKEFSVSADPLSLVSRVQAHSGKERAASSVQGEKKRKNPLRPTRGRGLLLSL